MRDPVGNFCVGRGSKRADVYLVDYGFAKSFSPFGVEPTVLWLKP